MNVGFSADGLLASLGRIVRFQKLVSGIEGNVDEALAEVVFAIALHTS